MSYCEQCAKLEQERDALKAEGEKLSGMVDDYQKWYANSESACATLKAEIDRLNALVVSEQRGSFSSVVRQIRHELNTAISKRNALKAENDRLLAVVDSKMQDLARANEVGVELTKELTQAREALREIIAYIEKESASRTASYGLLLADLNKILTRWTKALGGGG